MKLKLFFIRRTRTVLYTLNLNCSLYVKLKLFFICQTQNVLYTSNSTVLNRRTQLFLLHRTQSVLLNSAASLLNSVSGSFYFEYLLRENSRQYPFHQCILHEEFHYFVLCTLFKNVTVSCINSLHYSVDSGLCITLQL